ncbi:hypothetical protein V6N13_060763 [Hibiscus sabdariffa]
MPQMPQSDALVAEHDVATTTDISPPAQDANDVGSFGPWMLAERRPRRNARIHNATSNTVPLPVQGSRFNPILASDTEDTFSEQQPRKPIAPLARKTGGKKHLVSTGKAPRVSPMRKPLTVNLSEFPVLSRFSVNASTSRSKPALFQGVSLEPTRHSISIMKENADPNFIHVPKGVSIISEQVELPMVGDPPDNLKNTSGQSASSGPPNPIAGDKFTVIEESSHSTDGDRAMEMLE